MPVPFNLTQIRYQNFMIENMGFPYDFVGANYVRPLDSPEFQAGEHSSPLQK